MKKMISLIILTLMTSIAASANGIPFKKNQGDYKLSGCIGSAEGKIANDLEKNGNGKNPCDTFDYIQISTLGNNGLFTFSKSKEKKDAELKAVEGQPKAEIDAVLKRLGIFINYRAEGQRPDKPNPAIIYTETATSATYSYNSADMNMFIELKINASGQYLMKLAVSEQYKGSLIYKFDISGILSK